MVSRRGASRTYLSEALLLPSVWNVVPSLSVENIVGSEATGVGGAVSVGGAAGDEANPPVGKSPPAVGGAVTSCCSARS